ncbi:MAG: hypothetical protein Kow0069_11810 [Promethearchaeota archaeon]
MNRPGGETGDEARDATFQLALDHVLVEGAPGTPPATLRFWRVSDSVVVGRSQVLEAEVNARFCRREGVVVCRRTSGGGAVFLDPGCLVASWVVSRNWLPRGASVAELMEFFTDAVVESLKRAGVKRAARGGRSSAFVGGRKVSGAAGYHRAGRVLHHVTLLHRANLERLEAALLAREPLPSSPRASRYSPTTNLRELDVDAWKKALASVLSETLGVEWVAGRLTDAELDRARSLAVRLFRSKRWTVEGRWPPGLRGGQAQRMSKSTDSAGSNPVNDGASKPA